MTRPAATPYAAAELIAARPALAGVGASLVVEMASAAA